MQLQLLHFVPQTLRFFIMIWAFWLVRASPGNAGAFDVLLAWLQVVTSPLPAGPKVFESVELHPTTDLYFHHLPKALGCAVSIDRKARMEGRTDERIVVCTFGDASSNHASATTAFNAASWTSIRMFPLRFCLCETMGLVLVFAHHKIVAESIQSAWDEVLFCRRPRPH